MSDSGDASMSPPDDAADMSLKISSSAAADRGFHERYPALAGVPDHIIRKAWFSMAHMLLPNGAQIADMACGDGLTTYAIAVLNPHLRIVGIDHDRKKVAKANQAYQCENLEFRVGDMTCDVGLEPESLDAIINSFTLYEVYSGQQFDDRKVARALEYQFTLLKPDGLMFIRDYAQINPGEYVLLEMPDAATDSTDVLHMSETALLIWFSQNAKPVEDEGGRGFFLEELPPRFPQTRLFRLPYKWAYEFIIRKDNRAALKEELHKEYTYFTQREFRKTLRALGARALYSAPHWDDTTISKKYDGHFRLYDDNGLALGPPPTSFVAVAQKTGLRKSLSLEERRPSQKEAQTLRIQAVRNERTGRIGDIVIRNADTTEILPYYVTGNEQLYVFIHESLPRGIVNTVPRKGRNIDGKRWSGHMVETIAMPTHLVMDAEAGGVPETIKFAHTCLGLKPAIESTLEQGQSYYPAPDFIDDMIKTRFLRVQEVEGPLTPKIVMNDVQGFSSAGQLRAVNAQRLLDAIAVGMIPNTRLEIQILELYDRLGLPVETWDQCPLVLEESEADNNFDGKSFMKLKAAPDNSFKAVRGTAGQLRTVQSTFVDEGWINGGVAGMASRDVEFVLSDDQTLNKAVILPLTRKAGKVLVGMETEYMPIPQRHEGNGLTMRAPSVNLPRDVTNIYQARNYVADLFKVPPENVWRMGESYFCHTGVTPMRVFPFAVATKGHKETPISGPITYAPMKYIWSVIDWALTEPKDLDFLSRMKKVQRFISSEESEFGLQFAKGRALQDTYTGPAVITSTMLTDRAPSATAQSSTPSSYGNLALKSMPAASPANNPSPDTNRLPVEAPQKLQMK